MLIRKMNTNDISAVAEIEKQCFSQPWSEKSFSDSILREDTLFLVCELTDKNIVGYMGMYLSFDEANVTNVAVSPQYRKMGIGEQLVANAKTNAKDASIQTIFLEVRVSNIPAISLYEKMGFQKLGVRKNFYEHPLEDAYIMSCDIKCAHNS